MRSSHTNTPYLFIPVGLLDLLSGEAPGVEPVLAVGVEVDEQFEVRSKGGQELLRLTGLQLAQCAGSLVVLDALGLTRTYKTRRK